MPDAADPLEGQELPMLNKMLASIYKQAESGDPDAMDRVIKIMQLKRAFKKDREDKDSL